MRTACIAPLKYYTTLNCPETLHETQKVPHWCMNKSIARIFRKICIEFERNAYYLTFQESDRYVWSDGWYAPYRRWREGASNMAPSGDGLWCVTTGTDGLWASTNCDDEHSSVCELNFGKVLPRDGSRNCNTGAVNPKRALTYYYRPQRSWGKVIFSEACVNNSVRGGVRGFIRGGHAWFYLGACVVLFWGHAWFYSGGMHGFIRGGIRGFIRGACVVLSRGAYLVLFEGAMPGFIWGACMVLFGGHAWFYSGGVCMVSSGGCAWFFQFFRIQWDTVNEWVVHILLECILVPKLIQSF